MRLSPALLALSCSLALAMAPARAQAPWQAQPAPLAADSTLLTLSASGHASAAPDIARISAGVVTQSADSQQAQRDNATRMQRVMAAIAAAGISAADVQTAGISLSPQYQHAENQPPRITGYQASNTVNITVRDLARLGKVLDALASEGANQIDGPRLEIEQPAPLYQQARVAALATARAQADTYARELGLCVRKVVSLSEGASGGMPGPMLYRSANIAEMDTPVAAGQNRVSVQLDAVFELGR